jgi:hypothetical protein
MSTDLKTKRKRNDQAGNDGSSAEQTALATGAHENALIEVPYSTDAQRASFCLHIDVRLDGRQSDALRRVAAELDRRGARLANRQRIVHPTHAIKYVLELLADQAATQGNSPNNS